MAMRISKNRVLDFLTKCQIEKGGYTGSDVIILAKSIPVSPQALRKRIDGVQSKIRNIQLVQIQPKERLAATSERNLTSCLVTGCGEVRGMGYWGATQVKELQRYYYHTVRLAFK